MCPVCYGDDARVIYFPCGHGMCRSCTTRWFSRRQNCPTCRAHVAVSFCTDEDGVERLSRLRARGYDTTSVFITACGVTTLLKKNRPFKCNDALQSTH